MSTPQPTVDVQPVAGYSALKMTWQHKVRDEDVVIAFRKISDTLANSDNPIYIIVDLLNDPQFPILTTVHEAITPYRHAKLEAWLVIGSNWMAKTIEGALAKITRHKNVYWFRSEDDVLAYLTSHQPV